MHIYFCAYMYIKYIVYSTHTNESTLNAFIQMGKYFRIEILLISSLKLHDMQRDNEDMKIIKLQKFEIT